MFDDILHLAFIGPGGPEFLLVMLVLLMMFGAKDAPRILRKLNEIINQIRNTADGFKREVMYSDLNSDTPSDEDDDAGEEGNVDATSSSRFPPQLERDEDDSHDADVQDHPEAGPEATPDEENDAGKA